MVTIHTKKSGEISDTDLDKARTVSREVDRRNQPGELHCQRADVARRLGRAGGDGDRRAATVHVKGEHPAGANGWPLTCD